MATFPTFKLLPIFTFPLANTESETYNLLLAKILCSILAPFETIKESLNCSPEFNIKFPFISKSFPTVKLVSINTLPFTLSESFIVTTESILTRPFTYKLESILAFNVFTFKLILLDSEAVSLSNLLLNIASVSEIFNFAPAVVSRVVLSLLLNSLI